MEEKLELVKEFIRFLASNKAISGNEIALKVFGPLQNDGKRGKNANYISNLSSGKRVPLNGKITLINKLLGDEKVFSNELLQFYNSKKEESINYYIYYYYSYERRFKAALMEINIIGDNWSNKPGKLTYFSEDINNAKHTTEYELNRANNCMIASNGEAQVEFFTAINKEKGQLNFFTINIKGLKVINREYLFLTYSVVESREYNLSAGIGILERVPSKEIALNNIESIKKSGPDWWIRNTLFEKKLSLDNYEKSTYISLEELLKKHTQFQSSKIVAGFYVGYFIKMTSINNPISGCKGEIVRTILEIAEDGFSNLYYNINHNNIHPNYEGFFTFPSDNQYYLKGTFRRKDSSIDRFSMYLELFESKMFIGIFTGWTLKSYFYSSPIFFEKIDTFELSNENLLNEIIKKYNPKILNVSEIDSDVKAKLKLLLNKFLPNENNVSGLLI